MKFLNKIGIGIFLLIISIGLTNCKSQQTNQKAPFTITEKTYFYWVGGKKGTTGTSIKLAGTFDSRNLSFSIVYFQNHAYEVATILNNNGFILNGNFSEFRKKDINMHQDATGEYGNQAPEIEKKIPFDLLEDEALIVYSISGMEFYHKVKGLKQLETVHQP